MAVKLFGTMNLVVSITGDKKGELIQLYDDQVIQEYKMIAKLPDGTWATINIEDAFIDLETSEELDEN
ncbi:hypothetical protein ACFVRU_56695 [Streptomyces sp. NPDC057927]